MAEKREPWEIGTCLTCSEARERMHAAEDALTVGVKALQFELDSARRENEELREFVSIAERQLEVGDRNAIRWMERAEGAEEYAEELDLRCARLTQERDNVTDYLGRIEAALLEIAPHRTLPKGADETEYWKQCVRLDIDAARRALALIGTSWRLVNPPAETHGDGR